MAPAYVRAAGGVKARVEHSAARAFTEPRKHSIMIWPVHFQPRLGERIPLKAL